MCKPIRKGAPELSAAEYPVLAFLNGKYFMEHFGEVFGDEADVIRFFVEECRPLAAKLPGEIDTLLSGLDEEGARNELRTLPLYVGATTNADPAAPYTTWLEWVRREIAELIALDPPSLFDYLPFLEVERDQTLSGVQVLLGGLDQVGETKVHKSVMEAVQRSASEFFAEIGEDDWQLGVLLDLSDEALANRLDDLDIPYDADKIGMTRRDWLELARQTIRDIGAPPAWLQ
jgi:hypothetical protein